MGNIGVGDFCAHGDLSGGFEDCFEVFREKVGERRGGGICPEPLGCGRLRKGREGSCDGEWLTHRSNDFGVSNVVDDNFGHFGEMPAIPFLFRACWL